MSNKPQGGNNGGQNSRPPSAPAQQPNQPSPSKGTTDSVDFGESRSSTTVSFNPAPPPPPRPPDGKK